MKTRRALSLILVMAMILSMFTMILPASAAPAETRTGIHTRSRTVYTYYSDEQLMDLFHVDKETLQRMSAEARYAYMHNEKWDVRPYAIPKESVEADALFQVLYRQPECFSVSYVSYSSDSNNNLTYVKPLYANGYEVAMEQHSALMDAVQEIMCLFQRAELTDLELAILVHDYLAANFEYHHPTLSLPQNEGKYSAYNLLVEGTAVCQGYAEAFALIMMQFGINCGLCQSDTLNHAWSILELDGKEYHVDVTWDDPSYDMYGKVSHEFFLISTDDMNSHEDHYADDFSATPNNKEFDTAFWQDIDASFCLLENTIYYIGTTGKTSGALYTWKDGVSTRLLDLNYTWKASSTTYYPGCYSRLITDGEKLFYSTPNEIIAYEPATGKSESIYTYVDDEDPYCYIYGFNIKDNNLYINVHNKTTYLTLDAKTENTIIHPYRAEAVDNHVFGDPIFTAFPCEADGEARYDCIYCGFSKFETIPAAGHDWLDATCTEPTKCSVCGAEQAGDSGYILMDSAKDLPQSGDQLVIAVNNNGVYMAMTTTLSSKKLPGEQLDTDNDKITPKDGTVWTIETQGSGYAIKADGGYLAYDSSTNFKFNTTPYEWRLTPVSGGYRLTAATTVGQSTVREIYYQTSGERFAPYATSNANASGYISTLQFFKYSEGGSALGHTEATVPGKPATCTEDGLTDGIICSVCGDIIQEQETIPASGHSEETVAGKDATCTEDGLRDGIACSTCGEIIKEQETIPAHGHTEKEVDGSDPTCTEPGMSAGIICDTCGISLSDQEITPALGHDEIYTPNNDGTHTITCSRGDLSETAECTYTNGVCDFCDYEEPIIEVTTYKNITSVEDIKEGNYVIGAVRSSSYPTIYPATSSISSGDWNVSNNFFEAVNDVITSDQLPSDAQVVVLKGNNSDGFTIGIEVNGTMKYLGYTSTTANRKLSFSADYNKTYWKIIPVDGGGFALSSDHGGTYKYVVSHNTSVTGTGCIRGYYKGTIYNGLYLFAEVVAEDPGECQHPNKVDDKLDPTCVTDGYIRWSCPDCGAGDEEILPAGPEYHVPGEPDEDILLEATCYHEGIKDVIVCCATCGGELSRDSEIPIPMIPHEYDEDGYCSMCIKEAPGKTFYLTSDPIQDAEALVIYHPASGTALSLNPSDGKLMPSTVTVENGELITADNTAIFYKDRPDNKEFPLVLQNYRSMYLTSGETGNALFYASENTAYAQWKPVLVNAEESLFQLINAAAAYGENTTQALEFYKNLFTVYGVKDNADFYFQFYTNIKPCGHEWDEGIVVTEPKCNAEGLKIYTCTLCGDTKGEPIATVDHAWQAGTTVDPTCEADGYTPYTCPDCGAEKSEPIPSNGHNYVAGTPVKPTCTEDGYTLYTCSLCGDSHKEDIIYTIGHTWAAPASCTQTGYCKVCGTPGAAYRLVNSLDDLSDDDRIIIVVPGAEDSLVLDTLLQRNGKILPAPTEIYRDHLNDYDNLMVWTLVKTEDGFALHAADGYLGYPGEKTNFEFSEDPYTWIFSQTKEGFRIKTSDANRYIAYSTDVTTPVFGAYAESNLSNKNYTGDLLIFKYVEGGTLPHVDNSIPMDNLCDDCGDFIKPAALISRSISLNGNIAVNFYMSLCDDVSADPDAYMLFKQEGKEGEVKVYIKDCVEKQVRGKEAYVFSYEVAAKEMTDIITAQFFYGDTCTEEYIYSVKTYADNQRENMSDNESLMNLLDAMLHYGAASQIQFEHNVDRLANDGLETVDYSTVSIAGYDLPSERGTELVTFAGASLLLKSETTLRYFFHVDPSVENLTVTYNGTPLELVIRGNLYSVDIENISAPALDQEFTVTVNDGVQEANVTYGPLTYCQSIRSKATSADALKNVCAALYLYNQAANSFFDPAE